jgi:cell division protein FtsL
MLIDLGKEMKQYMQHAVEHHASTGEKLLLFLIMGIIICALSSLNG